MTRSACWAWGKAKPAETVVQAFRVAALEKGMLGLSIGRDE